MATSNLLQLKPGVEILPVSQLPDELRERLGGTNGDYAVSISNSRHRSSVVDPATAELLHRFRQPSTLAQAIRGFAQRHDEDPEGILREAWEILESLIRRGVLLQIDDPRLAIPPSLVAGNSVGAWTIVRPVQQLDDAELYLVRSTDLQLGALKIRCGSTASDRRAIQQEAAVLQYLDGSVAPQVLTRGLFDGRPFLICEWCAGVDAEALAGRWRDRPQGTGARKQILALARTIAEAYARLHSQGVLHADVHAGNLLVDREGRVQLIDFGLSGYLAEGPVPYRGGVPFFQAPETARALARGEGASLSLASEQFSVAALLYRLFTGYPYRDFDLERKAQLRQAAEAGMRPFRHRNRPPWPAVEATLERALDPDPDRRFPDMADLAFALEAEAAGPLPRLRAQRASRLSQARARVRSWLAPEGVWWQKGLPAPTASVMSGATGIALACYRMACLEDDPEMLSLADLWIRRGVQQADLAGAFEAPDWDVTTDTVGQSSPYHTESGVHAVDALVAHAAGQIERQATAVRRFLQASERPAHGHDLTLGTAGLLVVGAGLLETLESGPAYNHLAEQGEQTLAELWSVLDREPAMAASSIDNLGIAHGWAGFLFASLRWRQATTGPMPAHLEQRLGQLARLAEPWGRGVRWPWHLGPAGCFKSSMSGWCNGTAGHLMLWDLASRMIDAPDFSELARRAAQDVWDTAADSPSLCCGLVGRTYALLGHFRRSGDRKWLCRARDLAEAAAGTGKFGDSPAYSLFRGELSLALIASDLENPEASSFPFVESEGW